MTEPVGMQHRILYSTRMYTNLVQEAPKEARKRFASVMDIDHDGAFCLEQAFVAAVDAAEREANQWMQNFTQGGNPNRRRN
jgi:hypothetical protein